MKKTNHPLTNERCEALFILRLNDAFNPVRVGDAMRAAADWQLEQVLEWMEECPNYDLNGESEHRKMIEHLKESMRPTENN